MSEYYNRSHKRCVMIKVTRLNGSRFYINAEMIQTIESTPDTHITLSNGVKVIVKDSAESIIKQVIEYQRLVRNPELEIHQGE